MYFKVQSLNDTYSYSDFLCWKLEWMSWYLIDWINKLISPADILTNILRGKLKKEEEEVMIEHFF